ncbi:MAG: hypothetical protein ACKO9B_16160 [Planctomycetota bacterium]|jgi:hypothetical protein
MDPSVPFAPVPALVAFVGNTFLCGFTVVHVAGLLAAALSRLAEGTRYERLGQAACVLSLAAVGGLCGLSLEVGPGVAATSAVTLTGITMIAVVDLPRVER